MQMTKLNNLLLKKLIFEEKNSLSLTFVIILSIAFGEIIIIITLSVMNGFQNDFFLSTVNLEIGNIRIESNITKEEIEKLKKLNEITAINKIYETQGLGIENYYYPSILNVIAVDKNEIKNDKEFMTLTNLSEAEINIEKDEVIIGDVLAYNMDLNEGDFLNLVIIDEIKNLIDLNKSTKKFKIKSIFKSSYAKINSSLIFMNINYFKNSNLIKESDIIYQVKTKNLMPSKFLINKIKDMSKNIKIKTWNEHNKEFFIVLKIERNSMLIVLISIFIIISINIYYFQKRIIINKSRSLSILRVLGLRNKQIKQIFLIHSLIICITGGLLGIVLGISISLNINEILKSIDYLLNTMLSITNYLFSSNIEKLSIKIVKSSITPKIFITDLIVTFFSSCFFTIYSSKIATKEFSNKKEIEIING